MDYIAQLQQENSRKNIDIIAKNIGNNLNEFQKIVDIVYSEKAPLPQRASWVIATISEKHPSLITAFIEQFISSIDEFKIAGIKRNILLALCNQKIPKKLQSKLIDYCYKYIMSSAEPVAIKVHSMQIIANLCKEHPDLIPELKIVIEEGTQKNSAAFKARAKMILKQLST